MALVRVGGGSAGLKAASYSAGGRLSQALCRGGMPELLREAFGDTYSHDVITVRMPTREEQRRLDLPPGTPVLIIKGGTYDQEHRPLHYIEVVAAGGRIEFAYRYGTVPTEG